MSYVADFALAQLVTSVSRLANEAWGVEKRFSPEGQQECQEICAAVLEMIRDFR